MTTKVTKSGVGVIDQLSTGSVKHASSPVDNITLDASGNVGIGTSSPGTKLEINTGSSYSGVSLKGTSSASSGFEMALSGSGVNGYLWNYENGAVLFATNNTERARIDSSGRVTMPYQPSFDAYSPAQTGAGIVIFGSTRHNTGNHYSTSTGAFTAPIAGVYFFRFSLLMGNPYTASYHRVLWALNGTTSTTYGDTLTDKGGNVSYHSANDTLLIKLSANDTISVRNENIPTYGAGYGAFGGCLIG